MADALPTPQIILADESYQRRQFAQEFKAHMKNPKSTARRKGGLFLLNGQYVDANRLPIEDDELAALGLLPEAEVEEPEGEAADEADDLPPVPQFTAEALDEVEPKNPRGGRSKRAPGK